jgi:hypothetical protein
MMHNFAYICEKYCHRQLYLNQTIQKHHADHQAKSLAFFHNKYSAVN